MSYTFLNCTLDLSTFEVHRRGRLIKIEPKVFDVLVHLIEHRDRVVTKNELLDTLWPGEAVSDSVLPRCIAAARRVVGDTRNKQRAIQTVHGRGYRFVAKLDQATAKHPEDRLAATDTRPRPHSGLETFGDATKFVGRTAAMTKLTAALERAQLGKGNVALVVGEPGIGKTSVANELVRIAREQKVQVALGRCYEGEGAPAYWPWIQLLRTAVESTPKGSLARDLGSGASDLAEILPELRTLLPGLPASVGPQGEQARFRLFDAATRFLVARAKHVPLLIVIDDLHWADASSLGLLRFMAREGADQPIMLLGTYRDVEVRRGHPLADVLGALAREAACERVLLTGLESREIEDFVAAQSGSPPQALLAQTLRDMTDGNPFFLREVVNLLADQEDLSEADPMHLHALALPQGVRDAIGRRLSALSSECNDMLRAAAVLGRNFAASNLETMMALPGDATEDRLLELLGEALDAGAILESGPGKYAFVHALTRQTLYEELRAPQRITLHRRAGESLSRVLGGQPAGRLAELAHHFFEAAPGGDVDKAISYAVAAAGQAHQQHAYEEAVGQYERALEALDLLDSDPGPRRAELLLALGEELFTSGARDAAHERLRECADLARRVSRIDLLARAAIAIRGFGEMGAPAAAGITELLEEALASIGKAEYGLRAQLLSRLSAMGRSTMAHRKRLSLEALALAKKSKDPLALRDALSSRWWATLGPDQVEERLEVVKVLRAHSRATNDTHCLLLSLECALGAHLLLGDREEVDRIVDEYDATAATIRQPLFIFMGMLYRTACLLNAGRYEEAESLRVKAEAYGTGRVSFAELVLQGLLHWSHLFRRNRDENTSQMAAADLASQVQGYVANTTAGRLLTAAVVWNQNRDDAAARQTIVSIDHRNLERDEHWLLATGIMCDVAFAVDDRVLMEELYEALDPYSDLMLVHDLLRASSGSVESCLGELATGLRRYDKAVVHYERSITKEESAGVDSAVPSSLAGLARALLRRGAKGDYERARDIAASLENRPEGPDGGDYDVVMAEIHSRLGH